MRTGRVEVRERPTALPIGRGDAAPRDPVGAVRAERRVAAPQVGAGSGRGRLPVLGSHGVVVARARLEDGGVPTRDVLVADSGEDASRAAAGVLEVVAL